MCVCVVCKRGRTCIYSSEYYSPSNVTMLLKQEQYYTVVYTVDRQQLCCQIDKSLFRLVNLFTFVTHIRKFGSKTGKLEVICPIIVKATYSSCNYFNLVYFIDCRLYCCCVFTFVGFETFLLKGVVTGCLCCVWCIYDKCTLIEQSANYSNRTFTGNM